MRSKSEQNNIIKLGDLKSQQNLEKKEVISPEDLINRMNKIKETVSKINIIMKELKEKSKWKN